MFQWLVLLFKVVNLLQLVASSSSNSTVRIGALLDYNSSIGLRCLDAIKTAIDHVNKDSMLLNGTSLELVYANSNCDAFDGAVAALSLFESQVVAIAGPQSSVVSYFVSHMAHRTQVPLVSFSATDPALSEYEYPYFLRLICSDTLQMLAISSIISYYGWREVIALFVDDDYCTNGINVLGDYLTNTGSKIAYKAGFQPGADNFTIGSVLAQLIQIESRVFVVHMQPSMAKVVFFMANYLKMLSTGYVWIVTDAIAGIFDTMSFDFEFIELTQGVIGTRVYIPESPQLVAFLRARDETVSRTDLQFHAYELFAYDSVWMIAYALDKFLSEGKTLEFMASSYPLNVSGGDSNLARLKSLQDGELLLHQLQSTNFTGTTGFVQVDERGDREGISFEIINRVGTGVQVVGYWVNGTGCTSKPPSPSGADGFISHDMMPSFPFVSSATTAGSADGLRDVIWPGGSSRVPRGWAVPKNGRPLVIGVPNKTGYQEFVTTTTDANNITTFHGFCINVFEAAVSYLPYAVTYRFVSYGNGSSTPNYDELVEKIANKEFDAVVGDLTITTERSKVVDFTQPYTASGLVVLVPVRGDNSSYAWAFMQPFTPAMWCTTAAFFLLTGLVIWMLEHKKNRDFRGHPKKQVVTTLWFIFSTLFFSQRENVKSTLGRAVLVIWLFVVLIVTSSYTASLTSILTVQQLTPTIQGIVGLVASNVPIGFQGGSFVEKYLLQLNVPKERLVPLNTLASYALALKRGPAAGGVGAIVDELPYVQLFLSSECDFTIAGQEFTKSGWGFAFPKGSQLAIDMSTAILELSENGELQQIYDLWLSKYTCSSQVHVQSHVLNLRSFWGLFMITGITSLVCIICYYIRMIWQYNKQAAVCDPPRPEESMGPDQSVSSRFLRGASFLKSLASFIEEAEIAEVDEYNSQRRPSQSRSTSKEISPEESKRASMSERSAQSSARESMASMDGHGREELLDLIRELSVPFNSANNKGAEGIGVSFTDNSMSSSEVGSKGGNPSLESFKSMILKSASSMRSKEQKLLISKGGACQGNDGSASSVHGQFSQSSSPDEPGMDGQVSFIDTSREHRQFAQSNYPDEPGNLNSLGVTSRQTNILPEDCVIVGEAIKSSITLASQDADNIMEHVVVEGDCSMSHMQCLMLPAVPESEENDEIELLVGHTSGIIKR